MATTCNSAGRTCPVNREIVDDVGDELLVELRPIDLEAGVRENLLGRVCCQFLEFIAIFRMGRMRDIRAQVMKLAEEILSDSDKKRNRIRRGDIVRLMNWASCV